MATPKKWGPHFDGAPLHVGTIKQVGERPIILYYKEVDRIGYRFCTFA